MGEIVRAAYEARGLAPEDAGAMPVREDRSLRAIRAVEHSVEEVGLGVRVLAEGTRKAVEETVEGGKRSVEETTEAMHDALEESSERESERQESFLLGFTRRLGRVLPRDAKGIASLFGLGNVAEELTLLRGAITPVTSALGTVLLPAVKGLGVAVAAAGTAWAGFEFGQLIAKNLIWPDQKFMEHQWEIVFSDLRKLGIKKWAGVTWRDTLDWLTGRTRKKREELEREIPETAKARAGVAAVERLLEEVATVTRGVAPGAAERVRAMLGAHEIATIVSQSEAIQREVLGELLMRYGRETSEQLTSKIVEDLGGRRMVRETGGFLRAMQKLPELGMEIEQIMSMAGQRLRRGQVVGVGVGVGDLEKVMVESNRNRTKESGEVVVAVNKLATVIQKGQELAERDRRERLQPAVPPMAAPMEVGRRMETD